MSARYRWARRQLSVQGTTGPGGSVMLKVPLGAAAAWCARYCWAWRQQVLQGMQLSRVKQFRLPMQCHVSRDAQQVGQGP